jgi:hypothetical protein
MPRTGVITNILLSSGERVRSATFAVVAGLPPGVLRRKAGTDRRVTVGTTVTEGIPEGFRSDRRGRGATRGDGARRTHSPALCSRISESEA